MNDVKRTIRAYLEEHRTEIVSLLRDLISIPSVRGEAVPGAPFGTACADILRIIEPHFRDAGCDTELDNDGGYLLAETGCGTRSLGLFAHADVVPAGEGWMYTDPFTMLEKDGFLIGRGVMDDKSAVVTSLYCAKMLRELALPFHSKLVCFVGCNEESGMQDIQNYLRAHTPPDFALVPDTAFPLYRGNKGRILIKAHRNAPLGEIKRVCGGKAGTNVGKAEAVLAYSDDLFADLQSRASDRISVAHENHDIVIRAIGIPRHTALPEGSINATALIADTLRSCPFLSAETHRIMEFLYAICSDWRGNAVGIACDDAEFGPLTFVNYMIDTNDTDTALYFNIRFGAAVCADEMKAALKHAFAAHGFSVEIESESHPHIVPRDHSMLRVLLDTYENYTGTKNAPMHVNAGGTYGQYLPCAAEIGTVMWRHIPFPMPTGHGQVHQPDECISIEGLLDAMELTMLMLIACDRE